MKYNTKYLIYCFYSTMLLVLIVYPFHQISAQNSWFLDQQQGSDINDGISVQSAFQNLNFVLENNFIQPGDTLFLIGEFHNTSYDPNYIFSGDINEPHIWTQENTMQISNLHGTPDNYITIKSFDEKTVLYGDGANILRVLNSSYLRFEGLNIYGEVERIAQETALALQFLYRENGSSNTKYRVAPGTTTEEVANMIFEPLSDIKRPSYTDTRGLYFTRVHHTDLINNHIHHMPGNGFRVAEGDYINIIGNEVDNSSRKSYSGTHGLVVTKASSIDQKEGTKIFIIGNKVHHNYNEIYSWAPSKTFITPHIDEGKGISLQRNTVGRGWTHGRILVANNLSYWNGFSGIHSNDGDRIDFINNSCYLNS